MIDASKTYSVSEASELVGVSGETIRLKCVAKKLHAARVDNGPWRIAGASLLAHYAPVLDLGQVTVRTDRGLKERYRSLLRKSGTGRE